MIGSRLQDHREDDPTWGFVAQLGAERYTGEAALGSAPRVRLYVDEGSIYFAERDGDSPLQSRLVVRGALSPAQLARGGVFVDGTASLARLFTRDTTIDRHDVEVAVERITQEILDEVGPLPVGHVELTPLRHHDSGIHEWARRIQPPRTIAFDTPAALTAPARPTPPVAPIVITATAPPPVPAPILLNPIVEEPIVEESDSSPTPLVEPPTVVTVAVAPLPSPSPFSAPPITAVAASLPAPSMATDTGSMESAPETAPTLPKLSDRIMSVAEITATHAAITGPDPAEAGDRFTPTDLSDLDLPKLATRVMSVAEMTGTDDVDPTPEGEPQLVVAPRDDLPMLHLVGTPAPEDVTSATPDDLDLRDHDTDLPDDDTEQQSDAAPEPISPWATPAQNLAAVEIWEMVDEMVAAEQPGPELVTAGGPTEARGRWRRSKKG